MKSFSIQVNKDEYNKDKKFFSEDTSLALELTDIQDGIIGLHLQVPRGGMHLNGVGSDAQFSYFAQISFFVTGGFVYSRWRSTVTDGGCGQNSSPSVLVWFLAASRKQHSCLHLYCATTLVAEHS